MDLNIHAPGIYFGMPEDEYFADDSFSASGIKNMAQSPLKYWSESNMNPLKVERDRKHLVLGKAYHKMILEGSEAFEESFFVMPSIEDTPGAIDGGAALKATCKEYDLKASGTIADICERLIDADPALQLWPLIKVEAIEEANGRTVLSKEDWLEIKMVEMVLARVPSTKHVLPGGVAEVSIFWDQDGIPMKARMDKLKPQGVIDLKTLANARGKEFTSAVAMEVSAYQYYIQPIVYTAALKAGRKMWKAKGTKAVFGDVEGIDLKELFEGEGEPRFWFVFVQKGGVPDVLVREFARFETYQGMSATQNAYWRRGELEIERAFALYKGCMKEFGLTEPWVLDYELLPFRDDNFPPWMLDKSPDVPQFITSEAAE